MTRFRSLGRINPEHLTSSPVPRMRRNCFASPKRLDRPRTVEPKLDEESTVEPELDEESVAAHPVHSSSSRGNPKIPEGRARTVTTPEGVRDSGGTSERRLQPTSSFFKGRMEDLRPPTHRVHATPMALVVGPSLAAGCLFTGMPPRFTEAPVSPRKAPSLRRAPPNTGLPDLGVSHGSCRVAPGRTSPVVANHRPRPKAAGRPAKEVSNHVTRLAGNSASIRSAVLGSLAIKTRETVVRRPCCDTSLPKDIAAKRHRCDTGITYETGALGASTLESVLSQGSRRRSYRTKTFTPARELAASPKAEHRPESRVSHPPEGRFALHHRRRTASRETARQTSAKETKAKHLPSSPTLREGTRKRATHCAPPPPPPE